MKTKMLLIGVITVVMAGLVAPVCKAERFTHYIEVNASNTVHTSRTYRSASPYDESVTYVRTAPTQPWQRADNTKRFHMVPSAVPAGKIAAPVGLTVYVPEGTFNNVPGDPEPENGHHHLGPQSEIREAPAVGIFIHTVHLDGNNKVDWSYTFYVFDPFVRGSITIFIGGGVHTNPPAPVNYFQPAPTATPYVSPPGGATGYYMAPTSNGSYGVAPTMFGTSGGSPVEIYCF